jgi:hypothetical protein
LTAIRAPLFHINHELHGAIPLLHLQKIYRRIFPLGRIRTLRRIVSPAAVERHRLRVAIVDGFVIGDVFVRVFDIVAGRQDLQQISAGDLLHGSAGRSHEGLVDPGDRCRLARRDLARRRAPS